MLVSGADPAFIKEVTGDLGFTLSWDVKRVTKK